MLVKEIDFFKQIFDAYPHQREFFKAFFSGEYSYFMEMVHRRAGKDAQAFTAMWLFASIFPGNYVYCLPKIQQARNVVWEGKDLEGVRWVSKIPAHLIKSTNSTNCKIYFVNGSVLHITGADSLMQSHLGSNLRGICFSEFHKTHPGIWDYVRPIIKRSNGFAIFLFTAFGKGHSYRLFEHNKSSPAWHCRKLTVDDTRDNNGNPIFSPEQIQEERDSGMEEDLIQQEYYCSSDAAIKGTFFDEQMSLAYAEGRIREKVVVNPHLPVFTSWDIGSRDTNSIWFFQFINNQFHYFHQFDKNYGSIDFYVDALEKVRIKYQFHKYGGHFLPHDVSVTEWQTGKTRFQALGERGLVIRPVPRMKVMERVQVARTMFKSCVFDSVNCKDGIEALSVARSVYDANLKTFVSDEMHDWSSHPSAAFQYGLVGWANSYAKPSLNKIKQYSRNTNQR